MTAANATPPPPDGSPTRAARRYVELTHTLAMRQFAGRYRGNLTGALASLGIPLLFLATYTFVFSTLVPVRIRPEQTRLDYGFFLFAALIGWNLFSETVSRGPRLFLEAPHYVRKPLFPISVLVAAPCLAALYQAMAWLVAFALVLGAAGQLPVASLWFAPLVLAWTAALALGATLGLAALGPLVRDLGELVPPALALLFFLSPVLYPVETIARAAPWLAAANPVAAHLTLLRGVLLEGTLPTPGAAALALAWTALLLGVGALLYRAARPVLQDLV